MIFLLRSGGRLRKLVSVPAFRLLSRPRVVSALRLLLFAAAWAFLNSVFNLRYPGYEPTLWYLLPAIGLARICFCQRTR
jgi:hypothetical protein